MKGKEGCIRMFFCERKCRLNGEKEGKGECKHRLIKENEKVNA